MSDPVVRKILIGSLQGLVDANILTALKGYDPTQTEETNDELAVKLGNAAWWLAIFLRQEQAKNAP